MFLRPGNLLGRRNIAHLVFFFFTSIIAMKVISLNRKWKSLEGTSELLECFLSSPNVFYLRVIEGWTIHTKRFPESR